MGGAVPPLPQYSMAWCSVRGSTGTTLPLPLDGTAVPDIIVSSRGLLGCDAV
jgi:hypothetical protein